MNKEIKQIFGNRKNYLRFMSKRDFSAFLIYIDEYHKIPKQSIASKGASEMFNTYITKEKSTKYVPYEKFVTVTEKKAPTDESIKLYKEVYEKALKNVADVYTIKNNLIEGKVIRFIQDCWSDNEKVLIVFKINGEEHRKIIDLERQSRYAPNILREKFLEHLTNYFIYELFKTTQIDREDYLKLAK